MDTSKQYNINFKKPKSRRGLTQSQRESLVGWSFILPMFLGFCIFCFGPIIASFGISFTDWNLLQSPKFVVYIITQKCLKMIFIQCLKNTLFFVVTMVPSILVHILNVSSHTKQGVKGKGIF